MVLILIEIWQFWLKENVRFWHTTAKQEQGTYERNADLQLLSAFPLIGYIT